MSEEAMAAIAEEAAEVTPETAAEKAKRTRVVWPVRIMRVDYGGLFPVKDAPEFSEVREAEKWIAANGKPGETYVPARYPEKGLRPTTRVEEVAW